MKLSIKDLPIQNHRVLMRVDFNVPLKEDGSIIDDSRIMAALPSIRYVIDHGGLLVLMSHLGRPQGKKDLRFSLTVCAQRLAILLNRPILMAPDCIGSDVEAMVLNMKKGDVILLENVRFHEGEEEPEKEPGFVEALARLGELYVNDAFGAAHRAHASTTFITQFFPQKAAMGFLIEKEISHLSSLINEPKRPFFAIIGGAKVTSKAGIIKKLIHKLDALFIGGKMAFPFLASQKKIIDPSLCEPKEISIAQEILQLARQQSVKIHLPLDVMAIKNGCEPKIFSSSVPSGWIAKDIGPQTEQEWSKNFVRASTIFWNGPLGVYEEPPFDQGTRQIAQALASCQATTIIGGGDSIAVIQQMGLASAFTFLSTGGGATLEFLEYGHLPGIDALSDIQTT